MKAKAKAAFFQQENLIYFDQASVSILQTSDTTQIKVKLHSASYLRGRITKIQKLGTCTNVACFCFIQFFFII